jgi:hypothetical protein
VSPGAGWCSHPHWRSAAWPAISAATRGKRPGGIRQGLDSTAARMLRSRAAASLAPAMSLRSTVARSSSSPGVDLTDRGTERVGDRSRIVASVVTSPATAPRFVRPACARGCPRRRSTAGAVTRD